MEDLRNLLLNIYIYIYLKINKIFLNQLEAQINQGSRLRLIGNKIMKPMAGDGQGVEQINELITRIITVENVGKIMCLN